MQKHNSISVYRMHLETFKVLVWLHLVVLKLLLLWSQLALV